MTVISQLRKDVFKRHSLKVTEDRTKKTLIERSKEKYAARHEKENTTVICSILKHKKKTYTQRRN